MNMMQETPVFGGVLINNTNLVLCKNCMPVGTGYDWERAIQHCTEIDHFGFGDWRLPTFDELFIIYSVEDYIPEKYKLDFDQLYWSISTEKVPNTDYDSAWLISMYAGKKLFSSKTNFFNVRAVRSRV